MDEVWRHDIIGDMRVVLDTNVLVAGLVSRRGASHQVLRGIAFNLVDMVISVPLFLEYEAVLKRPTILRQTGLGIKDIDAVLDLIAGHARHAPLHFRWRPQLRDADDEMVLEAATNGGAAAIVTFNQRDFLPQATAFSVRVLTPSDYLNTIIRSFP
jgi:putative PIN family toxin of toxin-antitoxin system